MIRSVAGHTETDKIECSLSVPGIRECNENTFETLDLHEGVPMMPFDSRNI